ncbi:LAFE_0G05182g1_1 [Lachancea fermentati]|uniref:Phosphatidylinositol transfer protein SFH5 n=1 Tax=Lachancea fermentati TaxID=4955 RepID=A0A1G4MH09_LACFM|nr:LAFE_0G05182g1_1 [Lachancea fermentati]
MKFNNETEKQVFERLWKELSNLIEKDCQGYDELYGYKLLEGEFYDEEVAKALVYKFCKAYQFNYEEAVKNLTDTLNWRREFDPLSAAFKETHNKALESIGILTLYPKAPANKKVVTWNLYGGLLKQKEVFENVEKFLRYRIGLMERGLKLLDFTDENNDYMTQVHDYKGVSMWKMDPQIKKCTKQVIETFQKYYPELLYAKYFVNVPSLLTWVYDVVKKFVGEETRKKFVVLNDGNKLGAYIPFAPSTLYGGKSADSLATQNVTDVRPTPYALSLLEKEMTTEID